MQTVGDVENSAKLYTDVQSDRHISKVPDQSKSFSLIYKGKLIKTIGLTGTKETFDGKERSTKDKEYSKSQIYISSSWL